MKEVCGIYDVKAKCYVHVFLEATLDCALRTFSEMVTNPQSAVARHPMDYHLFHVASFDEQSGKMVGHPPHALGSGDQYVELADGRMVGDVNGVKEVN